MKNIDGFSRTVVGALMYSTLSIVLWSIKKNGLEKTLEDLRRSMRIDLADEHLNDACYEQMITMLDWCSDLKEKGGGDDYPKGFGEW